MNTETRAEPTEQAPSAPVRSGLNLSATQIIASALAATTATLVAGYLGLTGTVVGAAVASVITVSASAIYAHSINRTRQRVRPGTVVEPAPVPAATALSWRHFGLLCAGLFLLVVGVLGGAQLVAGRPITQVLPGSPSVVTVTTHPTQVVTQVVVPTTVTVTTTVPASTPASPTPTPTPDPTPTPTPMPTASTTAPASSAGVDTAPSAP